MLAAIDAHLEGTHLDNDLVIYRQSLARLADAGKAARALEGFGKPGLDDERQAIRPLGALEKLDRAVGRPDDDVLAVQRLQRRRLGDQDLAAAMRAYVDRW